MHDMDAYWSVGSSYPPLRDVGVLRTVNCSSNPRFSSFSGSAQETILLRSILSEHSASLFTSRGSPVNGYERECFTPFLRSPQLYTTRTDCQSSKYGPLLWPIIHENSLFMRIHALIPIDCITGTSFPGISATECLIYANLCSNTHF